MNEVVGFVGQKQRRFACFNPADAIVVDCQRPALSFLLLFVHSLLLQLYYSSTGPFQQIFRICQIVRHADTLLPHLLLHLSKLLGHDVCIEFSPIFDQLASRFSCYEPSIVVWRNHEILDLELFP